MGFWGTLGQGLRYLEGTLLGIQWPPIYVVWWKNCGDALNTLVCTRGKEITKKTQKTECLRREGYISPLCSAYLPKPLVTPWCMLGPMEDVITRAHFQLNRFRGLRWGTFFPNLGTLGFWVLELFAMYATNGRTDGQKQRLLPLPYGSKGIITLFKLFPGLRDWHRAVMASPWKFEVAG